MIGSNRIIPGAGIMHPVGNAELEPSEEKRLRRAIVQQALAALEAGIQGQQLYERVT
jgi:glycine/betaine/sarcosine/D-proline reductase family selenoprotein B